MEYTEDLKELNEGLRHRIMRINSILTACIILCEIVIMVLYLITDKIDIPLYLYVLHFILKPASIDILALIVCRILLRGSEKWHWSEKNTNLVPLFGLVAIMSCVIMVHYTFAATYNALMLPLCLSVMYGDVKLERRLYLFCNVALTVAYLSTLFEQYSSYPSKVAYNIGLSYLALFLTHLIVRSTIMYERDKVDMIKTFARRNFLLTAEARRDSLTQLYNFKSLKDVTEKWLASESSVIFLMLDIDNFKSVNDTYGHEFGNVVLKRLSMLLTTYSGDNVFVARYGGEEFGVLFRGTDLKHARKVAEMIRTDFELQGYREVETSFTISGGLALASSDMAVTELFSAADDNLYRAKKGGKNQIVG